jgi:hypothetical protein
MPDEKPRAKISRLTGRPVVIEARRQGLPKRPEPPSAGPLPVEPAPLPRPLAPAKAAADAG